MKIYSLFVKSFKNKYLEDLYIELFANYIELEINKMRVLSGGNYMVYTSYFAKLRKIPKDITPICIARKLPPKVDMLCCPALYPTSQMLYQYKSNDDYTEEDYIVDYNKYVLDLIDPKSTTDYLLGMAKTEDIVLVCYEKSGSFCHRNLVSKWLNDNGIECKEWSE